VLLLLCSGLVGSPLRAQLLSGGLEGTVLDPARVPLAGARISLRGEGAARETKSDARGRVSVLGLDPGVYALRVESAGFLPADYPSLSIAAGQVTSVLVQMSPVPGETVTVTAEPPGGDLAAQPTLTLRREELARLPSTRDPWAIATRAPGVLALGHNQGGSESGQQFFLTAGGVAPSENAFLLDGVVVTDPLAAGASLVYFDFEQFDEIGVAVGLSDPGAANAGVTINLVTRRPTQRWRGSARALRMDGSSQARGSQLQRRFAGHVESIDEWGGEFGGPLASRHLWGWASYGASDIARRTFFFTPVEIDLRNVAGKFSLGFGPLSAVAQAQRGEKTWLGRGVGPGRPPETGIDQRGPFDLFKLEGHWNLSSRWNLEASAAGTHGEFSLTNSSLADILLHSDGGWSGGFPSSWRHSRGRQIRAELLGASRRRLAAHDLRLGLEGREQVDGWLDRLGPREFLYIEPATEGERWQIEADQAVPVDLRGRYLSAWAGDTLQWKRVSLQLGLRFDRQSGSRLSTEALDHPTFPDILPRLSFAERSFGRPWQDVSPRLSAAYSLGGLGQTTFRGSLARFPARMNGNVGMVLANDLVRGAMLTWSDADADGRLDPGEAIDRIERFGYDEKLRFSEGVRPEIYDAAGFGVERHVWGSTAVALDWTVRRASQVLEARTLVRDGGAIRQAQRSDYSLERELTLPGAGGAVRSVPIYGLRSDLEALGEVVVNGDRSHVYQALTLSLRRPDAGGWALESHWTLSDWRWRIGRQFRLHDDPTDAAAGEDRYGVSAADGDGDLAGPFGTTAGGAARGAGFLANTRWDYALSASRALGRERPWGFLLGLSLTGRDGYPIALARRTTVAPGRLGWVDIGGRDAQRRGEAIHALDLRIEKPLHLGPATASLSVDVFNVANSDAVLQYNRAQLKEGPQPVEVLAPRIVRVGLRLAFE